MVAVGIPISGVLALRPIGSEVDDRQQSTRLERLAEAGVHRVRVAEMVVDATQDERVAAPLGEVRGLGLGLDHGDVLCRVRQRPKVAEPVLAQLGGVDPARRPDLARNGGRELAAAGSDVRHRLPGLELECRDEVRRIGRELVLGARGDGAYRESGQSGRKARQVLQLGHAFRTAEESSLCQS